MKTETPLIVPGRILTAKQAINSARKAWKLSAGNGQRNWVARIFDEGVKLGRAEALGLKCVDGDPIEVLEA